MDDREFADLLYSQWTKTYGAEDKFWVVEKNEELAYLGMFEPEPYVPSWSVLAVDKDQNKSLVGVFHHEADADFTAVLNGCVPDLVRRLHDALDEADRLDKERDEQEAKYAEAIIRNQELQQRIDELSSKAADVLWKTERPM